MFSQYDILTRYKEPYPDIISKYQRISVNLVTLVDIKVETVVIYRLTHAAFYSFVVYVHIRISKNVKA